MKKTLLLAILSASFYCNAQNQEIDLRLDKAKNYFITSGVFIVVGAVSSIVSSSLDIPDSPEDIQKYNSRVQDLSNISTASYLLSGVFIIVGGVNLKTNKSKSLSMNTSLNNISFCYKF